MYNGNYNGGSNGDQGTSTGTSSGDELPRHSKKKQKLSLNSYSETGLLY